MWRSLIYEEAVLASYDDVDIEYVSKQVVPAASRILAIFGSAQDALMPSRTPKNLLEFVGS